MIPSNTICVSQEGPANALALNKDCTQVVIAGRNVFKVFSIDENEFSEVCNLRVGKNLNLNFSSIDVAWSTIEENTLATAATNGAVVVWNLGRSGRSKQEHVFSDHKRTVNKVSFHLTEPALLISGSQDGMMKCFDLRMKEVARTFISNTESIRDVQFSPHQAHTFAAVSENGSVQLWDVRRHERCLHQFTAHSGPVFACDWHPEAPWLATASRDKTIKVWDIQAKPNLEHTIYTIASVGHVKWRPQKKFQVASCALVLDCAVHVWDVRRPHVPLATFAEHRDVTTAIAWQAEPHSFLSTSRDGSLYRHRFTEAAHPVLWANPHGVCVSARGEVAHAQPECPLPALPPPAAPPPDRHFPGLGRKQPTAGSLSAQAQNILEVSFPDGAASTLTRYRRVLSGGGPGEAASPACPVVACALEYRVTGALPHELAEHNAKVARKYDRHMVGHVWDIVKCVYSARAETARTTPTPAPPRDPPRAAPPPASPPYSGAAGAGAGAVEEPPSEAEEFAESFKNSGVLGMPTLTIYIPNASVAAAASALPRTDEVGKGGGVGGSISGWVSAATAHYVNVEAADWTLPEEAFPLRAAPAPPLPPALHNHTPPHHHHDKEHGRPGGGGGGGGAGSAGGSASPGGSSSPSSALSAPPLDHALASQNSRDAEEGEGGAGPLTVRAGEAAASFESAPLLAQALKQHAALGDAQTPCLVLLVLGRHRSDLFPYIDEGTQEHWLLGYIEFLQRNKLWNQATEVVRNAWVSSVWQISQQSTSVSVCCARCGRRPRPAHPRAPCACAAAEPRRRPPPGACALCHQVVRGLYAWCQGCSHGGHLHHMRAWMQTHRLCPAGCGHRCQLP